MLRAAALAGVPAVEVRAISNEIGEPDRSRWQIAPPSTPSIACSARARGVARMGRGGRCAYGSRIVTATSSVSVAVPSKTPRDGETSA